LNLKDYLGETNLYDKKEKLELNKPKSWLKSVSAFANGRGGKLIFGVKEDNEVSGIKEIPKRCGKKELCIEQNILSILKERYKKG